MNNEWEKLGLCLILLSFVVVGCAVQSGETNTRQADIGLGIVEGTKGYQTIQRSKMLSSETGSEINGQVIRIEGAAYIVRALNNTEVRLPFDENTTIDRPAHVGDWIQASVDESGLARFIQNIDDQVAFD